jgi:multimeric flavodoxin WrbA
MRAVILDGSDGDEMGQARDTAAEHLRSRGYQVDAVRLRDKDIADCLGCFGCWVKEPGECVVKDDAIEVAKLFNTSDAVVLLTPVTFGGYSYHLKKAIDRSLCFSLPFFVKIEGETRHPRRYDVQQTLVVIGLLPRRDGEAQATFGKLVEHSALNLQPVRHSMAFVFSDERPELAAVAVREALVKAGVGP